MRYSSLVVAIAASLLVTACGGDPAGPPKLPNGTMSARVDGVAWNAASIATDPAEPSSLVITGTNPARMLVLLLLLNGGPGTQVIGGPTPLAAGLTEGSMAWAASRTQGGEGSVTVTTATVGHVAGTFELMLAANEDETPATRRVTLGAFDVTY